MDRDTLTAALGGFVAALLWVCLLREPFVALLRSISPMLPGV